MVLADRALGVARLVRAARSIAADARLVLPLAGSTGLSVQGVALALSRALETETTDAQIASLVARAVPAEHVHVILSANVFTAALRALAVARAASGRVTVKPSRRDALFTRTLIQRANDPAIEITDPEDRDLPAAGEVHVYGRDETLDRVRAAASRSVLVRAHGAGMGVAIVDGKDDLEACAARVADDVVLFDQRGCLSPRVAIVLGDSAQADRFVSALAARLGELAVTVPRGMLDDAERREVARYAATVSFAGSLVRGDDFAVGLAPDSPIVVPPPGRHVHVALAHDERALRSLLAPIERFVVAVGVTDAPWGRLFFAAPDRLRISALGQMQRPPLDGPVDLR